jgi:hypothetical protein
MMNDNGSNTVSLQELEAELVQYADLACRRAYNKSLGELVTLLSKTGKGLSSEEFNALVVLGLALSSKDSTRSQDK